MLFNSFEFLIFLPVVFLLYWLVFGWNVRVQNAFILVASYFFYGCWDWRFLFLLFFVTLISYSAGLFIDTTDNNGRGKKAFWCVTIVLCLNLGLLGVFKYFNFFVQSFVDIFHLFGKEVSISTVKIVLPIGISFYIFTTTGYVIDVYRRKINATKDALSFFAYVSFFPALFCGPIGRATKQLPQFFTRRVFNYEMAVHGVGIILWGFFIKLCVADRLGVYVDAVYGNIVQHNGTSLLVASLFYTIQIYCDFCGYSLLALGTGKLLGIELINNFERPYFAKTVTEFWKRWHISLTTWFRDYLYFSLGGNRVSHIRWILNILIVFTVSGLWHGAAYTFIIWGALHGIIMVIEREIYGDKIKTLSSKITIPNILRMALTFALVTLAWIFFRADTIGDAFTVIGKIFTEPGKMFVSMRALSFGLFALSILIIKDFKNEFFPEKMQFFKNSNVFVRFFIYTVILTLILLIGVLDSDQFIYFQF